MKKLTKPKPSLPLHYKNSTLYFEHKALKEIAQDRPTPFYLYSESTLANNYKTFSKSAHEAGIKDQLICYALKANPNRELLKILKAQGCGADIVSGGELIRALEAGITPNKIIFSGVGKTELEIKMALNSSDHGIYAFNVESTEELKMINKVAQELRKIARVAFRFNPKIKAKTHKHISTGNKTHKFGILQSDIIAALKDDQYWDNCCLVGISIHIGSQLTELSATKLALKSLFDLAAKLNQNLEFIDVGGGLGIDYHENEAGKVATIKEYMKLVGSFAKKTKCRIVFEPGRILMARTGVLVSRVIRSKTSDDHHFVVLDCGMNDLIRPSLYEAYHKILPEHLNDKTPLFKTDVVGPICETSDCFGTDRLLPVMAADDLVVIADSGAYGMSMSSNYNLRGKPEEVLLSKKMVKTIAKRQHYQDI